mmetsp:Transcript_52603/g.87116  ORF Transcript_52603/g.87116 Transcript_52603/m.87116 type:complete len:339 (-) Transcript_52603:145-1161(-)
MIIIIFVVFVVTVFGVIRQGCEHRHIIMVSCRALTVLIRVRFTDLLCLHQCATNCLCPIIVRRKFVGHRISAHTLLGLCIDRSSSSSGDGDGDGGSSSGSVSGSVSVAGKRANLFNQAFNLLAADHVVANHAYSTTTICSHRCIAAITIAINVVMTTTITITIAIVIVIKTLFFVVIHRNCVNDGGIMKTPIHLFWLSTVLDMSLGCRLRIYCFSVFRYIFVLSRTMLSTILNRNISVTIVPRFVRYQFVGALRNHDDIPRCVTLCIAVYMANLVLARSTNGFRASIHNNKRFERWWQWRRRFLNVLCVVCVFGRVDSSRCCHRRRSYAVFQNLHGWL